MTVLIVNDFQFRLFAKKNYSNEQCIFRVSRHVWFMLRGRLYFTRRCVAPSVQLVFFLFCTISTYVIVCIAAN